MQAVVKILTKKRIAVLTGALLTTALVVGIVLFTISHGSVATLQLGGGTFRAQVATTDQQRMKGLSGVSSLRQDEAMVFVVPENRATKIWMKDMLMTIDAVWLDEDKRVVHIEQSLEPNSYPTQYGPDTPVRYVVELPENTVKNQRIKQGDKAKFDMMNGDA